MKNSIREFEYRSRGIPCIIAVMDYADGQDGYYWGAPEDCFPEEPTYIDWLICDKNGRRADWIYRKLTESDKTTIENVIKEQMHGRDE